jgi:hypothetical protein
MSTVKLRGKYVGDVSVAQSGNTVVLVFKDPNRNKNKNAVYYLPLDTLKPEYLGECPVGTKDGMASAAILTDGRVLLVSASSPTGAGSDCELYVTLLDTNLPVGSASDHRPINISIVEDTVARLQANAANNSAKDAKNAANDAVNRTKSLEKALTGELSQRDLTEQEILDRIWQKSKDAFYDELGNENSGVVGRIKDLIREELGK